MHLHECFSYIIFQSHLICLEQRGKPGEILASAIGSLLVFAQQVLWYLAGKMCKEQLMDSAHCSEHQLWSCEGSGCGVHAAIAITRLVVGSELSRLCHRLQASQPREQSSSNHSARAAEYIGDVQTAQN